MTIYGIYCNFEIIIYLLSLHVYWVWLYVQYKCGFCISVLVDISNIDIHTLSAIVLKSDNKSTIKTSCDQY